jgi:hypothetical protein
MRAGHHLPETCETRSHEEPLEVVRREVLGLVGEARTGADERHVPTQDVDELRKLVETRLAQPAAERRDRVLPVELVDAVRARNCTGAHCCLDVVPVHGVVDPGLHRAELQHRERAFVQADALLPEEDRAR